MGVEVTRVALNTSTGNQDITISGFGTPSAAIFIYTNALTDDTVIDDAVLGVGFAGGGGENTCCIRDEHNQGTTNTSRAHSASAVISLPAATGASEDIGASFVAWITDGVRINVDNAGAAILVTCIFFSGTENAYAGTKDDLGTGTGAIDITDPGFEPDLVLMTTVGDAATPPSQASNAILSFGAGLNDGSATQRNVMYSSVDNNTNTTLTAYIGNDSIVGQLHNGALTWDAVIGGFDGSGFSITPNASSGSDIIHYLALKFPAGTNLALFDSNWPSAGNKNETAPGFEPAFGLVCGVDYTNGGRNSPVSSSSVLADMHIAAFTASSIYTNSISGDDALSTVSNTSSLSADRLRLLGHAGGDRVVASSYAFDASGWDFTISTNPAQNVLTWGLAIGAGATGATNPKGPLGHPLHGPFGGPV